MSQTTSTTLTGQCIAEFLGTALLVFFGVGCVAAARIAGAQLACGKSVSFGGWVSHWQFISPQVFPVVTLTRR